MVRTPRPTCSKASRLGTLAALSALAALSCNSPSEMPSMQEMVAQSKPPPRCERLVEVLRQSDTPRPYDEVSRLSVTCHPSLPDMCERSLRARACELHADAVLLMPNNDGTQRNITSARDQLWKSALLVRWR